MMAIPKEVRCSVAKTMNSKKTVTKIVSLSPLFVLDSCRRGPMQSWEEGVDKGSRQRESSTVEGVENGIDKSDNSQALGYVKESFIIVFLNCVLYGFTRKKGFAHAKLCYFKSLLCLLFAVAHKGLKLEGKQSVLATDLIL